MRALSDFDHEGAQRRSLLDLAKGATVCRWFGHDWSVTSILPTDHWTWCNRCRLRADYRAIHGGNCLCCDEGADILF